MVNVANQNAIHSIKSRIKWSKCAHWELVAIQGQINALFFVVWFVRFFRCCNYAMEKCVVLTFVVVLSTCASVRSRSLLSSAANLYWLQNGGKEFLMLFANVHKLKLWMKQKKKWNKRNSRLWACQWDRYHINSNKPTELMLCPFSKATKPSAVAWDTNTQIHTIFWLIF